MITAFSSFLNIGALATIGPAGATPVVTVENLLGQSTRITWSASKTAGATPDNATVSFYNLNLKNLAIMKGLVPLIGIPGPTPLGATISFGWQGIMGLCAIGDITKIIAEERSGTNIITTIEFAEGAIGAQNAKPLPIQGTEQLYLAAFQSAATALGWILSPQFLAALKNNPVITSVQTLNAVFGGNPLEDFETLIAGLGPGFNYTIQNKMVYLLNIGQMVDQSPPIVLTFGTGLIRWSEIEKKGVQIEALGHPDVRPGQQIVAKDEFNVPIGLGPLRVESVNWSGDTLTGCYMTIIARVADPIVGA
jgi:hypothetical protein